uniref:Uncharacterized protein n=1 Tax=Pinguiococcus pyrenoidosus TaxID=172671 RepID=A0A7R9YBM9_9STRA
MGGSESVPDVPGDLPPLPTELPDIQNVTLPDLSELDIFQNFSLDYTEDLELPEPPDTTFSVEDFLGEELPSDLGTFLEETLEVAIEVGAIDPDLLFDSDCICADTGEAAVFNASEVFAEFCSTAEETVEGDLEAEYAEITCEDDEIPEELSCNDILQLEVIFGNQLEGPCVEVGEDSVLSGLEAAFNVSALSEVLEERCCIAPPSFAPSKSPTFLPTISPTAAPSPSPTGTAPTISFAPTATPSVTASLEPTISFAPTSAPSVLPSWLPSGLPSLHPTALPTANPSPGPTNLPSETPSLLPSAAPSPQDEIVVTVEMEIVGLTVDDFDEDARDAFKTTIAGFLPGVDPEDIRIKSISSSGAGSARARRLQSSGVQVEFEVIARVSQVAEEQEDVSEQPVASNTELFEAIAQKLTDASTSGDLVTELQAEDSTFDSASVDPESMQVTATAGVPDDDDGGGGGGGDDTVLIAAVAGGAAVAALVAGVVGWHFVTKRSPTRPASAGGEKIPYSA